MSELRVIVAGGPKVGKTTVSTAMGPCVSHCDDHITTLSWSELSEEISRRFDDKGPWVIEGVQTPRAIRKWLERNPEGVPADLIMFGREPKQELTKGQASMTKGVETVWNQILPELQKRGAVITYF